MNRLAVTFYLAGLLVCAAPAQAFTWSDLWENTDQQGAKALANGEPKQAANLFKNPNWKGVAHYRAGNYQDAASAFTQQDNPDNNYNLGNALAKAGQYQQAIAMYDKVLQQNPQHEDARYNRELVKKLLDQQNSSKQKNAGNKGNKEKQADQNKQQGKEQNNLQDQQKQQAQQNQEEKQNQQSSDQQTKADQSSEQQQSKPDDKRSQQDQQKQQDTKDEAQRDTSASSTVADNNETKESEQQRANRELLNQIPDDPSGLLRRKFQRDHERLEAQANF